LSERDGQMGRADAHAVVRMRRKGMKSRGRQTYGRNGPLLAKPSVKRRKKRETK